MQTLCEEDYENNVTLDLFEAKKTPLSKLIEDPASLQYWNEFIDKSEEEQKAVIEDYEFNTEPKRVDLYKTEKPYLRISSKIRRTLRIKKNLSVQNVKLFEDDIIHFFEQSPKEKYVIYPNTSFDRLLTHAVAQYHCLYSFSKNQFLRKQTQNIYSYLQVTGKMREGRLKLRILKRTGHLQNVFSTR